MQRYSIPDSLLDTLHKKLPFAWYVYVLSIALPLLLGLVLVAYKDDILSQGLSWDYWRTGLQSPIILIYIIAIYPLIKRLSDKAVQSMVPFLETNSSSFDMQQVADPPNGHRGEWVSLVIGVLFAIILSQPWRGMDLWLNVYLLVTGSMMFSVLAWLIYLGISNTRYLTHLSRNMNLDIFNIEALAPVARWSLGESGAFIGGIAISIAFQRMQTILHWQVFIIYIILVCITVAIFFMSMWSTHTTIRNVKQIELTYATENLTDASRKLKQAEDEDLPALYHAVSAWGIYERKIREIREWPYDTGIIGRLILSAIAPGAIYLIKILTGTRIGY